MKKIIIIIPLLLLIFTIRAQEYVSGKLKVGKIDIKPTYERGLPPNLFVELNFQDDNGNGILESEEKAKLDLFIQNKGKGSAQGLEVIIRDNISDRYFQFENNKTIYFIHPEQSVKVTIPIEAAFDVRTAEHKLEILVKEHFGYDMDPAYLVLNTLEYQRSRLNFAGMEIYDYGEGTGAIVEDGQLQAGEMVKAKIVVQNIGQNVAQNTKYKIETSDPNIYIEDGQGELGDLAIGEVKELWVTFSPNKRVDNDGKLPIYLTMEEEIGKGNLTNFQLPIALNQKPPQTSTLEVKADLDKIKKQVARFEYSSNKFTANVGQVKNINKVVPSLTKRDNSVAVIFGVENYDNLPPAPYAANDAEIIKKYFKERLGVEQVVIYKDNDVSGLVFDDVFNPDYGELQRAVVKGETDLFVFYSGHGVPSKDGKHIYLFPSDGKIERITMQGYDLSDFYKNLEKLGARSVTVFLDACFSGASRTTEKIKTENLVANKGVRIQPKVISPWLQNSNFTVFNSSSASETSLGFDPSQTGLFTYYLCVGLQGEADQNNDHKITAGELHSYIHQHVQETSRKIFGTQTPQFNGNNEMILLEY